MKVKVKICGIRTVEAARAAFDAGADFLGFNFVCFSKRYIEPEKAYEIIKKFSIKIVGVFQNERLGVINRIRDFLNLDYVQLHGSESPEFCQQIRNVGLIKVFRDSLKFKADYFLLDREKQGEGKMVDLGLARSLAKKFPIMLAGGLTPESVSEIVRFVRPAVVDVASGVETDGKQDIEKITRFIQVVKNNIKTTV